jgi:tetratricopeptide (TPR) repeat protein
MMPGENQKVAVDSASILTSVYQTQGRSDLALQLLNSALEKAPGAIELRLKLGYALLNPAFFQPEQAAANLLLVCQQMPDYDLGHQLFGQAMARRGSMRIAQASLLEALRLNPNNTEAKATLTQVRSLLGEQPPSRKLPQVLLEVYPSRAPRKLVQVRYDPAGRPVSDGIEVEFHENGRLKRFQDFDQGVRHGLDVVWDSDGRLLSRMAFQDGKRINIPGEQ